jgi:endonuclease/exonuclease/phosphatase (EEP) superfamily protein YafD
LPRLAPVAGSLRVMTLNALYTTEDGAAIERLARTHAADLICLQELNPRLAEDLVARLGGEYAYHALLPEEGVTGLGMFSRYPLHDEGEIPDPAWRHGAQVARLEFEGEPVLVLNVHALSPSWPRLSPQWASALERQFRAREAQVGLWLDRVRQHEGPVILAGDLNSTDQNVTHRWLAEQLEDAHRQSGWGLGHTAPASLAGLDGVPSPSRLFRLDYVWYSEHWQATRSYVGGWDGHSDHLPVLASLRMRSE